MAVFRDEGFTFRQRHERINWRLLSSVDVNKVAEKVDIATLQENISNVAFCDVEAEVQPSSVDPNLIKLFRLSQMIIQYLMYSQKCLTETIASLENELSNTKKLENKRKDARRIHNLRSLHFINYKCSQCPKYFINETYLEFHVHRRHVQNNASDDAIKDIVELKEKVKCLNVDQNILLKQDLWKYHAQLEKAIENYKEEIKKMFENGSMEMKAIKEQNLKCEHLLEQLKKQDEGEDGLQNIHRSIESGTSELNLRIADLEKLVIHLQEQLRDSQKNKNPEVTADDEPKERIPVSTLCDKENLFTDENDDYLTNHNVIFENHDQKPRFNDERSAVQHNIVVEGMREELVTLLNDRLKELGIFGVLGLDDSTLHSKLASEKKRRLNLLQKHEELKIVRDIFTKNVDKIAKEKLKLSSHAVSSKRSQSFLTDIKERIQVYYQQVNEKRLNINEQLRMTP